MKPLIKKINCLQCRCVASKYRRYTHAYCEREREAGGEWRKSTPNLKQLFFFFNEARKRYLYAKTLLILGRWSRICNRLFNLNTKKHILFIENTLCDPATPLTLLIHGGVNASSEVGDKKISGTLEVQRSALGDEFLSFCPYGSSPNIRVRP